MLGKPYKPFCDVRMTVQILTVDFRDKRHYKLEIESFKSSGQKRFYICNKFFKGFPAFSINLLETDQEHNAY